MHRFLEVVAESKKKIFLILFITSLIILIFVQLSIYKTKSKNICTKEKERNITSSNNILHDLETMNITNIPLSAVEVARILKVYGGRESTAYEVPYQALITGYIEAQGIKVTLTCQGSIYNERFIITVAHCFVSPVDQTVISEEHFDVQFGKTFNGGLDSRYNNILKIHIHENAKISESINDIAIVELKKPIRYSKKIQSIRIQDTPILPKQDGRLIGWGWGGYEKQAGGFGLPSVLNPNMTESNDSPFTFGLRIGEMEVMSREECMEFIKSINKTNLFNFHTMAPLFTLHEVMNKLNTVPEHTICAIGKNGPATSCHGDSGGPLACGSLKKPTLCGIVINGLGCEDGYPYILTDIYYYKDWIESIAGKQKSQK